jgi:hypothetical protein
MSQRLTYGVISQSKRGDPFSDFDFTFRLQTHNGDRVPLGLYQDAACTIPAIADGDPVGGWRDELSESGIVLSQSSATKRPILRFIFDTPVLEFDGIDDFLSNSSIPTISGVVASAVTATIAETAKTAGRLLSISAAGGSDTNGTTGFVPVLKIDVTQNVGTYYDTYRGTQPNDLDEWFDFLSMATGSEISTWMDGVNKQTVSVVTSSIASTRVKIGGSWGGSDTADLWSGYIQNAAIGAWNESDAILLSNYFQSLRPST